MLYPGGKVSKPGEYIFEGDLNNIPTAPDWLLAEMKQPPRTINKKDLDFTDRTQDEIQQIIFECLSVISPQGPCTRDHWVKIGMAIHSALPTDMGLHLGPLGPVKTLITPLNGKTQTLAKRFGIPSKAMVLALAA